MTRIPADKRQAVALDMQADYDLGSSIRNLATRHRLSYGTVRTLLREVKTELRPRGGRRGVRPRRKT